MFFARLPDDWCAVPFGNLMAEAAFGPRFSGDLYAIEGNVATLRTTDIGDDGRISYETMPSAQLPLHKFEHHFLKKNDLLVTRSGTCGIASVFGEFRKPVLPGAFLLKIRIDESNDVHYYRYFFNSSIGRAHVLSIAAGAVQQNINLTNLKLLEVPVPPLLAQRKIIAILSAYDDLIENNLRRIKILEEMAQSLYREWFVKFRFPGHQDCRFSDSPLGPIPERWQIGRLGDACNLTMGQSPKSEFYNKAGLGQPFHQGVTEFGDRFPGERLFCTTNGRIAEKGDILFSVRAPVGRINIANTRMVIGRGLSAIRHKAGHQWFTFHLLKERFQEEDTMGGGTIFKSVTKKDMETLPFLLPDPIVARQFENIVEPTEQQIENLTRRNQVLRRTRDLLLPKLISGELDVSELDITVPELA